MILSERMLPNILYSRALFIRPPLGLSFSGLINEMAILIGQNIYIEMGLGTIGLINKVPWLMGCPDPKALL